MRIPRIFFLILIALAASLANAQTQYYAAIDLGSKGTKAALFSFHKSTCPKQFVTSPADFCDVYGKTINTKLVSSMKDGQFTDAGIKDATGAVERLINEMQAAAQKSNLQKVDYFVVGSSGVAKAKNKDELAASVQKATGIRMDFIDGKREGYFGLLSAVPTKKLDVSLYVDIGSGNTKLGCIVGSGMDIANYRGAEIPYGSVSGRNKGTEKNPSDIKAGIQQVMHDDVAPAYEKESMDAPCLRNRERIYWTGGAAWATATFMHPTRSLDPAVIITRRDIEGFLARLNDGSWNQKPFQYSFSKDTSPTAQKESRDAAEKDKKGDGHLCPRRPTVGRFHYESRPRL